MVTNIQSKAPNYLTAQELADRLRLEEATLQKWREGGEGPTATKLGFAKNSPIRYKLEDVEAWEASLPRITPIAQNGRGRA